MCVGGSVATILQVLLLGPLIGGAERKRVRVLAVRLGVKHLDPIVELIQEGKITTVIDRRFPLSEVPEALRYLGTLLPCAGRRARHPGQVSPGQ